MIRSLTCSSAIALVFLARAAAADVTPEEVWESWQAASTAGGQELTVGSTARNGDTLEVTDIALTFKDTTGGSGSVTMDKLSFKDNGDGTVAVTMPESYPVALAFPVDGEGVSSLKLTVSQPGLQITAGGSATETSYDIKGPSATVKLDEMKDESGTLMNAEGDLVLTDFASTYLVVQKGDDTSFDTSFSVKSLAVNYSGEQAGGGGQGTVAVSFTDFAGANKGTFPTEEFMAKSTPPADFGFIMDSDFKFGAMKIAVDGVTGPDGSEAIKFSADATEGTYDAAFNKPKTDEGGTMDASFGFKTIAMNFVADDPSGTDGGTGEASLADFSWAIKGNFLGPELMEDMAAAIKAGFFLDTDLKFGALKFGFDGVADTKPTKLSADSTGGGLAMELNTDGLDYTSALRGVKFSMSVPEVPFPVDIAFSESALNLTMPILKTEKPEDFIYLTKLTDLTISDGIWNLFDPGNTLSREPATFIMDTKGTILLNEDLSSAGVEAMPQPPTPVTFDITQLLLKAAGAEVSATGQLTFDSTDLVTFPGTPRPDGLITTNIKGVHQLIDNLIALGFVTNDDAMGFRMGLAMFAKPGAGPDELTSKAEFRDKGVFLNGMPMMEMLQ
ncbi:DUF2125 domain-containing protein [Tabrizicola sp.]|uniref:DUF2125 domain-containing protein n=1 Tax=Tabrizicola sp. TaxID=2005166 RepID=UPI003F3C90F5